MGDWREQATEGSYLWLFEGWGGRVGDVQGSIKTFVTLGTMDPTPQANTTRAYMIILWFCVSIRPNDNNVSSVCQAVGRWMRAGRGYNGRTVKIFFYKDIHCREDDSLLRPTTTPLGRTSSSLSGAREENANGSPVMYIYIVVAPQRAPGIRAKV